MAWKGRTKKPVDFSNLLVSLLNSKLQQTNFQLYQTIDGLINKSQQSKDQINQILQSFFGDIIINDDTDLSAILGILEQLNTIINLATFWTENDETTRLPSSRMAVEGAGITLDYSVAGQVTISAAGAGSSFIPMVNGNEPPELMSNGAGDLLLIPYEG